MYQLKQIRIESKSDLYRMLEKEINSLFSDEHNFIANAANLSSLLYYTLPDLNWVGLYINRGNQLVLGPFQGKPACVRIQFGQGVCGKAAAERKTVIVTNVHRFPGHITCDSASNSEIVVPLVAGNNLIGVLDLDSPILNRFDADDQKGLEKIITIFLNLTQIPK